MKKIFAAVVLTMALSTFAVADPCDPTPGQTSSPPGCGNGLTDPNGPFGELAPAPTDVTASNSDPTEVELLPLAIETIRLAFSIW